MKLNMTLKSLLLILPFLTIAALGDAAPSPSADTGPDASDMICHEGRPCYPRVFVPTTEFRVVEDDQELPKGLHVRMDMTTGKKEAKIYIPGPEEEELSNQVVLVDPEAQDNSAQLPKAHSQPQALEDQVVKPPRDAQSGSFALHANVLNQKKISTDKLLSALSGLEDLAHEIYWGTQLATPKYFPSLLAHVTRSDDARVRASAALVLGAACSNNPKALKSGIAALGGADNLVKPLLAAVETETNATARLRALFALAQAVKGKVGRESLVSLGGPEKLALLGTDVDPKLKAKVAVLIEDTFLNGDMRSNGKVEALGKRLSGFCAPWQKTLVEGKAGESNDEKIFSALVALKNLIGEQCKPSEEFAAWIDMHKMKANGRSSEKLNDDGESLTASVAENYNKFVYQAPHPEL